MHQVSSRTGWRHKIEADMPDGDTALRMLRDGRDLPAARCGRQIQPVNFYEPGDDTSGPRYRCSGCWRRDQAAPSPCSPTTEGKRMAACKPLSGDRPRLRRRETRPW